LTERLDFESGLLCFDIVSLGEKGI